MQSENDANLEKKEFLFYSNIEDADMQHLYN